METTDTIKKANDLMSFERFSDPKQVLHYLATITGQKYVIASASNRKWGSKRAEVEHGIFYQVMPYSLDNGFFDWYCNHREYYQFFESIDAAIIHFVYYWHIWQKEVKEQ